MTSSQRAEVSEGSANLPQEISRLPKKGFSAPVGEWIVGPCADRFRADVLAGGSSVRDLIDVAHVRRLFDEQVRGGANHTAALWSVWMLARWYAQEQAAARAA